jgi:hypothetical protein
LILYFSNVLFGKLFTKHLLIGAPNVRMLIHILNVCILNYLVRRLLFLLSLIMLWGTFNRLFFNFDRLIDVMRRFNPIDINSNRVIVHTVIPFNTYWLTVHLFDHDGWNRNFRHFIRQSGCLWR